MVWTFGRQDETDSSPSAEAPQRVADGRGVEVRHDERRKSRRKDLMVFTNWALKCRIFPQTVYC